MANLGHPACSVVTRNAAGMADIATGAVSFASAIGDGIAAARCQAPCDDALMAGPDMKQLSGLEAENARLCAAYRQRQESINLLRSRAA